MFSDTDRLPVTGGGTDGQNVAGVSPGGGAGGTQAPQSGAGSGAAPSTGGMLDGGAPGEPEAGGPNETGGMAGAVDGGKGGGGAAATAGTGGKPAPERPVCGNGKLEAGEQCDDAGHAGSDGCSATCEVVCSDYGEAAIASADHHCYVGYDEADFEGAIADCEERGGHIVSISSEAENAVVSELVRSSKWIGAFEDAPITSPGTGQYEWVTGEPFAYESWADEEPDSAEFRCDSAGPGGYNESCYQHCILMLGGGLWSVSRCDASDGYVCEWEPPGE
ncbi:MAG TPA: lectin-like protein [Polyangiaceae bacterium]